MTKKESLKLFNDKKVRTVWDDEQEKWYFSVVDVIDILTDSPDPKRYWSVLKSRIKKEGLELTTICSTLKLRATDGKMRLTDVAETEQLFRIIQSAYGLRHSNACKQGNLSSILGIDLRSKDNGKP